MTDQAIRMPVSFRDDRIAIIEVGSRSIRSIFGLSESLKPPEYRLYAQCSVDALGKYSCGEELVASHKQIFPIQEGIVSDWDAFTALMQFVVFRQWRKEFPPKETNLYALSLVVPTQWTNLDKEIVTRIFMEQFFVYGFRIFDQPIMNLVSINATCGIVVDIGYEKTDVVPILDSQILHAARKTAKFGGKHITNHLLGLLKNSPPRTPEFEEVVVDFDVAEEIKCSGICEVLVDMSEIEQAQEEDENIGKIIAMGKAKEYLEKKQREKQQKEDEITQAQYNELTVNGNTILVGPERFKAADILFSDVFDIADLIFDTIQGPAIDEERRCEIWDNLVIVGKGSRIKGLKEKILKTLKARYELKTSIDLPFNPAQIRSQMHGNSNPHLANIAPMPQLLPNNISAPKKLREYFPEWKESENPKAIVEESSFLGASVCAKMTFSDASGSMWFSRDQYSANGPSGILLN